MELMVQVSTKLILSAAELRLVSKGLRGTLTDEEKPEALALQERIALERHAQLKQAEGEAQKTVTNIEKARGA